MTEPYRDCMIGAIQRSWCAETSSQPELWTPENPALGQCAVTALMVQDSLGGDLVRCVNEGVSHYYNWLPFSGGGMIDMTRSQFASWSPRDETFRARNYVLGWPDTLRRYDLLCRLVRADLGNRHPSLSVLSST